MTNRNYLAFDLEIAKEIPDSGDWRAHSPLGVSCAATLTSDTGQLITWFGKSDSGQPAGQMSQGEVAAMVQTVLALVHSGGYSLVTWNGLGFDLPVVAEESGLLQECQGLALNHIDMMFHVFCEKGHYLALDTAAKGMGIQGKAMGMTGKDAPRLWAQGDHQKVLDYLEQDVRTTADLALAGDQSRTFEWTSQRGNLQQFELPSGWRSVQDALKIEEPDTSWMTNPPRREDFTAWLR